ncbi:MAG: hypothetical protein HYY20_00360 [Candidatus Tectomicrobia bacterium]|uniref:Uncharacterized protein n=1 Tax=Tectimicrobiota bacterium TaxID=2528274 RepID=A0A932CL14_UNCTE|nr:hypothetical protein [Candidatus Tectomicrobia bacterium]
MTDLRKLLAQVAAEEDAFRQTTFLAPCVRGGQVRAKVVGLVYTFAPQPRNFEGWGIFQPVSERMAAVIEEASLPQVAEYLRLLKPLRLRLAHALRGQTWLAYPVNESDARQRLGEARPVPIHLVSDGAQFEPVVARWDGGGLWYEEIDRRDDPTMAESLRDALRKVTPPEAVRFKGMTPEMRTVYGVAAQQANAFQSMMQQRRDEARLRDALRMGGGELRTFDDRGDFWRVEWTTRDGEHHTSAIAKGDLTVISAGICLSGKDRDFDLQSLVGVVEG